MAAMSKPWLTLLPLASQAFLLLLVSRLLFSGVLEALADRRGKGLFLAILRLPGNLVHEFSHCLGFWLCGYRVRRVVLCIFDPRGRGSCHPGRPWSPVTLPWLAVGLAALMPLVIGSVVLVLAGMGLEVSQPPPQVGHDHNLRATLASAFSLLDNLDWHQWQTYVFLYLALSIGAELAPSPTDLRHALPALLAVLAGIALFFLAAEYVPPLAGVAVLASGVLNTLAARVSQIWTATLAMTTAVAVVLLVPGLMIRALRG